MHAKFFNFFFFSPNLLAALDNALILVSGVKRADVDADSVIRKRGQLLLLFLSVRKMFGARKRGLMRQKLEIMKFFPLLLLSASKRFLKTTKKFNFSAHSRKFETRKILFWPIHESLCSRKCKHFANFSARECFCSYVWTTPGTSNSSPAHFLSP